MVARAELVLMTVAHVVFGLVPGAAFLWRREREGESR